MSTVVDSILALVRNGQSVFITGGAGVGKTYTTRTFLEACEKDGIRVMQCGTTGVSALQLSAGNTLHSSLGMAVDYPDDYVLTKRALEKFYFQAGFRGARYQHIIAECQSSDVLLIDEISMCSAYLLDAIDLTLRVYRKTNEPLGGIVLVAVGDFLQLPPVYNSKQQAVPPDQKKFAYESKLWMAIRPTVILLHGSKRQLDQEFSNLLSKIRSGNALSWSERELLKRRAEADESDAGQSLYIAHRRKKVCEMNAASLKRLKEENENRIQHTYPFPLTSQGDGPKDSVTPLLKELTGTLRDNLYLEGGRSQTFVEGERVMLIINFEGYVNGDTGTVERFVELTSKSASKNKFWDVESQSCPKHREVTESGQTRRTLKGFGREIYPVVKFDRTGKSFVIGSFHFSRECRLKSRAASVHAECIPLICCYACTIHKVQGCTISIPLVLDCEDADWQPAIFYVGLSRATSLDTVYLKNYCNKYCCNQKAKYYYEMGYVKNIGNLSMEECVQHGTFIWIPMDYETTKGYRNERSPGTSMKVIVDALEDLREAHMPEWADREDRHGGKGDALRADLLGNSHRNADWQLSITKMSHPEDCFEDDQEDMLRPVLDHLYDKYKRKRSLLWDSLEEYKKRKKSEE
jgi:hypothetical protein